MKVAGTSVNGAYLWYLIFIFLCASGERNENEKRV